MVAGSSPSTTPHQLPCSVRLMRGAQASVSPADEGATMAEPTHATDHVEHMTLPSPPTVSAPDGSDVRVLLNSRHGGMAHFEFPPGETSQAVRHRTVDELWYFVRGRGRMWTSAGADDGFDVHAGVCVSIPVGTLFQVRSFGFAPLAAIGATMPQWPGEGEAEFVTGPWEPTLEPGPQ